MPALRPLFALVWLGACRAEDPPLGVPTGASTGAAPPTTSTAPPTTSTVPPTTSTVPPPDRPAGVVVVVLDTTRWDSLGALGGACEATPHLDRLATEGVVLERVIAPRGLTYPTIATLLTAGQPRDHGVWSQGEVLDGDPVAWPAVADRPVGVFAVNGCPIYETAGALDAYACVNDPAPGEDEGMVNDPVALAALQDWVATQAGPFVAVLHLFSAHSPYFTDEATWDRMVEACPDTTSWNLDQPTVEEILARGMTESEQAWMQLVQESGLAYDDALVGELVGWLDERGFFEDGLLLVGADHGEEDFTHRDAFYLEHAEAPWPSVTRVGWIAYAPGALPAGLRIPETVCMQDLGATLFGLVGAAPAVGDGVDLWDPLTGSAALPPRTCFGEVTAEVAYVVDGDDYLLWSPESTVFPFTVSGVQLQLAVPERALYDLVDDPYGLEDRAAASPSRVDELVGLLCAHAVDGPTYDDGPDGDNAILRACGG